VLKWIILSLSLIIVFPIFVRLDVIYNDNAKKVFAKIYFFGILILNLYAHPIKEGIIFHLTKRKAVILQYNKIFSVRKKFKPIKDFHIINFDTLIEIGSDDPINTLRNAFLINFLYTNVKWFFYNKKPYLDINTIIKTRDNKIFNIYNNTTIIFNLLIILISLIKIIVEKIFYALKHRKQQNKQSG